MKEYSYRGEPRKGKDIWCYGLTKETDPRVMSISINNKGLHPKRGRPGHPYYPMSPEKLEEQRERFTGKGNPFYGKKHSPETIEILKQAGKDQKGHPHPGLKGRKHTEEHNRLISQGLTKFYSENPQAKDDLSNSHKGKPVSQAHRDALSLALMGHEVTQKTRDKISTSKTGTILSEETRRNQSLARKKYLQENPHEMERLIKQLEDVRNDPEMYKKIFARKKMSKEERRMQGILYSLSLPYEYVGNFQMRIGKRFPDFVDKSSRKIIEVFGDYWHKNDNPQDKIDYYQENGYSCLVIWASEMYTQQEKTIQKILDFHNRTEDN
ncbi:MAG: NUMOD3 domain-containing DNA-binding protein [bacterium]